MVNLVALILLVTSGTTQSLKPVDDPAPQAQMQRVPAPAARPLTPEQKAWFAHAIDHILDGK